MNENSDVCAGEAFDYSIEQLRPGIGTVSTTETNSVRGKSAADTFIEDSYKIEEDKMVFSVDTRSGSWKPRTQS